GAGATGQDVEKEQRTATHHVGSLAAGESGLNHNAERAEALTHESPPRICAGSCRNPRTLSVRAPETGHEGQKLAQVPQDASPRLQARASQGPYLRHQQDEPALQGQARLRRAAETSRRCRLRFFGTSATSSCAGIRARFTARFSPTRPSATAF